MDPRPPLPQFDREREQHLEELSRQRVLQQQEELVQQREREREREYADRQERERQERERQERDRQQREHFGAPVPPHQNNAAPITIHQPVASRLTGAIHSPGGLLANHGGAQSSGPLGAPSGPGNAFGGPLHSEANRAVQHNPQPAAPPLQQHQPFPSSILGHNPPASSVSNLGIPGAPGFGGSIQAQQQQAQQQQEAASRLQQIPFGPPITQQPHQIPGAPALGQGSQQPILNVSWI